MKQAVFIKDHMTEGIVNLNILHLPCITSLFIRRTQCVHSDVILVIPTVWACLYIL